MGHQLIFVRQTAEVETDHFVSSLRRLATGPQCDQHARDDRAVGLNLDAVLVVAQQMPTAQHVFEEPEEDFNGPAIGVDQSNRFGGNIEQVRRDAKDPVTVNAA